jgi:hypothetical protein
MESALCGWTASPGVGVDEHAAPISLLHYSTVTDWNAEG